jgi:uncharacterized membrane protein YeaQ/YmgE (transglycosylase-associated protein family)
MPTGLTSVRCFEFLGVPGVLSFWTFAPNTAARFGGFVGFLIAGIFGFVASCGARMAMPGPDPLGIVGTIAIGMAGAAIGYFIGTLVGDTLQEVEPRSLSLAVIGGLTVLFCYRAFAIRYTE